MSNLYEKQALENYLNDGITHGKKISYGSLGRNKNEISQQHVNNERQHIIMNSKLNSKLNSNRNSNRNSKRNINILPQPVNPEMVNPEMQPVIIDKLLNYISFVTNTLLQPVNSGTVNPEMQPVIMNNTKNENKSKTNGTEFSDKTKSIIIKQKHLLFTKLLKEEQICENILNSLPKHEMDGIK
jgi:hypothetical protein